MANIPFLNNAYFAAKVGIGTESPSAPLHINGGATSEVLKVEATQGPFMRFVENGTNVGFLQFTSGTAYLANMSNGAFRFRTNNTDQMILTHQGRLGIGTTSPSEKLDVVGRTKITQSGDALRINSSDANGSYATWQNNGTNIGYIGSGYHLWSSPNNIANNLGIRANTRLDLGVQASVHMTILNSGNVGIGTNSPSEKLDVAGVARMDTGVTEGIHYVGSSVEHWGDGGTGMQFPANDTISLRTTSSDRLYINSSGNVGIGTTSPQEKLDVSAGNIRLDDNMRISWSSSDSNIGRVRITGSEAGDYIAFATDNSDKVRINNTGVGIGTTSPGAKLHISTGAAYEVGSLSGSILIEPTGVAFDGYGAGIVLGAGRGGRASGGAAIASILDSASDLDRSGLSFFYHNATFADPRIEGMRIDSDGNVGIGTTSPTQKLDVDGAIITEDYRSLSTFYLTSGDDWRFRSDTGNERMRITSGGNVGIGTTNPSFKLHVDSDVASGDVCFIHHDNPSQSSGTVMKIRSDAGDNAGSALLNIENNTGNALYVRGDRNVGINKTNPTRPLHVSGIAQIDNGSLQLGGTSSVSGNNPQFRRTNSSNDLAISTGGSDRITVLGTGNVGIGMTNPGQKLQVYEYGNSAYKSYTATSVGAILTSYQSAFSPFTKTTDLVAGSDGTVPSEIRFLTRTSGTSTVDERMRINSSGNVGIGDTPSFKLDVNVTSNRARFKAISGDANIELSSIAGHDWLIQSKSDSSLAIYDEDEASERMRITSSGNVGIGTSSPGSKLHVQGTSFFFDQAIFDDKVGIGTTSPVYKLDVDGSVNIPFGTSNGYRINGNRILSQGSGFFEFGALDYKSTYPNISTNNDGTFRIQSNGSTLVTVNQLGNVGIGTTSPDGVLHIKKDNATATFEIQGGLNSHTTAGAVNGEINFGANDASTTGGIGASIKNISEISNGAHNGLAFFTGLQSRTPYLQQMLYFTARGGLSFGTTNNSYGTSGQILKSNADAPPSWVNASTVIGGPYLPLAGGTMSGNTNHSDNVKDRYGTGNDFQIWHDGSNTFLSNEGEGHLHITNTGDDRDIIFKTDDGSGATTSYMVIDGSAEQTRFYKDTRHTDGIKAYFGNNNDLELSHDGNNSWITNATGDLKIYNNANDKDIVFASDNGSGGTTAYLTLDGSTTHAYFSNPGNVGIGTTSPGAKLHIDVLSEDNQPGFKLTKVSDLGENAMEVHHGTSSALRGIADFTNSNGSVMFLRGDGNVGIGTTSPTRKLSVHRSTAGSVANFLHYTDATAFAGLYIDADNVNNIVEFNASGDTAATMAFQTGNSERMRIAAAGNVGIGTTSPSEKLEVAGNVKVTGNSVFTGSIDTTAVNIKVGSAIHGTITSSSNSLTLNARNTGIMLFQSGSVEKMRIANNGNLGIGTTSPQQKLDVIGRARASYNTSNYYEIGASSAGGFVVGKSGGVETVNIRTYGDSHFNGGNFGIGAVPRTISSYRVLDISGSGGTGGYIGLSSGSTQQGEFYSNSSGVDIVTIGAKSTKFFTNSSERMRINSSGNVGIGTTSPTDPLTVTSTSNSLGIRLNYPVTNSTVYPFYVGNAAGTSYVRANNTAIAFKKNGGACTLKTEGSSNDLIIESASNLSFKTDGPLNTRMTINSSGNVGIGTTSPSIVGGTAKMTIDVGTSTSKPVSIVNGTTDGMYIRRYDTNGQYQIQTTVGSGNSGNLSLQSYGGNVGIGTTNPSFKFHVDGGSAMFDTDGGNNPLYIARNSSTNESLKIYVNDTEAFFESIQDETGGDHGRFAFKMDGDSPNAYTRWLHGSTERMRLSAAGNLGIGTTSPSVPLDVAGVIRTTTSFVGNASIVNQVVAATSGGGIKFKNNSGTDRAIITDAGNVGIGTTSPGSKLEVSSGAGANGDSILTISADTDNSTSSSSPKLVMSQKGGTKVSLIEMDSSNRTHFSNGDGHYFSGGNVGIGTTSPGYELDVNGVVRGSRFFVGTNAAASQWAFHARNNSSTADSGLYFNNNSSEIYLRNSSNVIGARIRSNSTSYFNGGDVGIGIAVPQERLHISGETHPSIKLSSSSDGNYNVILNCGYRNEALNLSVGGYKVFTTEGFNTPETTHLYSNNSKALSLASNQAATFTSTVTATNFINSSDERLKENIEEVRDNNVEVNWKTFNFKTEKEQKRYGVIAQELEKTNPEFVREDSQGFKSVAYIDLLIAKIAELEARIQKLEK